MPCDHVGPIELIEMADAHLRAQDRKAHPGMRFSYGENLTDGMWSSVITEIERRGDLWIVVRLDRRRDPLPDDETGLKAL